MSRAAIVALCRRYTEIPQMARAVYPPGHPLAAPPRPTARQLRRLARKKRKQKND